MWQKKGIRRKSGLAGCRGGRKEEGRYPVDETLRNTISFTLLSKVFISTPRSSMYLESESNV